MRALAALVLAGSLLAGCTQEPPPAPATPASEFPDFLVLEKVVVGGIEHAVIWLYGAERQVALTHIDCRSRTKVGELIPYDCR